MTKIKSNKTKKTPRDKYTLGSFVSANRDIASQYNQQVNNINGPQGGAAGQGALSGAGTGASLGTSIMPGIGTAIGAVVGGIGGWIFGGSRDRKEREAYRDQINQLNSARRGSTQDLYESSLDTNNENPYGVYKDGGDILNPQINIEKGELQINPETGKILREYSGINPETGGLYEKHAKGSKKDTKNNMVTAEEGSFIITTKEAKKYKEAVDNNDKLYQNSIMSNIRNQKNRSLRKYNTGGLVDPIYSARINGLSDLNIQATTIKNNLAVPTSSDFSNSNSFNLNNIGNVAGTALNYLPSIYNMFQGSRQANTMPYNTIRMNIGDRQRILSNLPQEMSVNPALNNIRNSRRNALRSINQSTNNPNIARANKLALESSYAGAENQALYNNQLMNNQIRSQRAGILSNLSAQDQARDAQNVQLLNNTLLQNRHMQLAKQQQFDYGLTQLQQMYQNNRTNRQRRSMEQRQLDILNQIFPALSYYPNLTNQGGGN